MQYLKDFKKKFTLVPLNDQIKRVNNFAIVAAASVQQNIDKSLCVGEWSCT